jgi:hypothetical protein
LFGCRHYLEFPAVKLLDYGDPLEHLVADPNPFALVTAPRPWSGQQPQSNFPGGRQCHRARPDPGICTAARRPWLGVRSSRGFAYSHFDV